jgi:pilus assembly protein CpaB
MQMDLVKRPRGLLLLSLSLGLMAAWSVHLYISRTERAIQDKFSLDYMPRIVSARTLKQGTQLTHDDLAIQDFPQKWLIDHSYGTDQLDEVLGSYLRTDLSIGQLILSSHLSEIDTQPLNSKLKVGMRAVSIPIETGDSSIDMISIGDEVDLFVTFDHAGRRTTSMLLRSVPVLAAPTSNTSPGHAKQTIQNAHGVPTVEVSQDDAQKLVTAKQGGVISAVVRSARTSTRDQDNDTRLLPPQDLPSLLGLVSNTPGNELPEIIYGDRLGIDIQSPSDSARNSTFESSTHE